MWNLKAKKFPLLGSSQYFKWEKLSNMLKGLRQIILVWKFSKGHFKKLLTSDTGKAGTFAATWYNFIKLALQRRTQLEKIPWTEVSACQLGMKFITAVEDLGFYLFYSHSSIVKYQFGLLGTSLGCCAISRRSWTCLSECRGGPESWWECWNTSLSTGWERWAHSD